MTQATAALVDAHERAVDAAFGSLEREACWTRRGHWGAERVRGEGFVAASYRHQMSRAGDSPLHTHVVVANMTRAQSKYTALDAHVLSSTSRQPAPCIGRRSAPRSVSGSRGQREHVTSAYLEDNSVVLLGVDGAERRYTTRDLLACERAIVDAGARRVDARVAVLDPGLAGRALTRLKVELSAEQRAALLAVAASGNGVEMVPALAGTGRERPGCSARWLDASDRPATPSSVSRPGRAARELGQAIGAPASTLHQLITDLDRTGELPHGTVIMFDEAGMAPTRQTARLLAHAEQAGAKVIAAGDAGQLPSVQARGWFDAVTHKLGAVQLREVVRQRHPDERVALEALHDGDPDVYLAFKQQPPLPKPPDANRARLPRLRCSILARQPPRDRRPEPLPVLATRRRASRRPHRRPTRPIGRPLPCAHRYSSHSSVCDDRLNPPCSSRSQW